MTDLGMKIDIQAKGANKAASDIDKVSKSAENLEKKAKSLGYFFDQQGRLRHSNGQFAKSNDEVANSLRNMKKGLDSSSSGALRLNESLSKVNNTTQQTSEVMGLARRAVIGLISFQTISNATKMADVMTNLRSQVRFVTGSYEEATQVQARLLTISNETFASLEATSTLYTRTARAMDRYGKSQQEILTFTEAINNAMRVGGVGAAEQASALLQLSQALGSGVLQGDEFKSIAEAAPILLDVLAKNTGIAREELKKLGSEGELTSELIFNAISKSSEELKRQASTMPMTVGGSLTILKNNMLQLSDEVLNQSGIMSTVSNSINFIANNLEVALAPALGVAAIAMARLTSSTVASATAFGAGSAEALRYQLALARMTGASNAMSISMVAGSQAVRLLSGAMALLGGPVGLATLAATGITAYALSTKEAKKGTQELQNELLQLEQRFKNLDQAGRDAAFVQLGRNLTDAKKQYEELKRTIQYAERDLFNMKRPSFFGKESSKSEINKQAEDIVLMKGELSALGKVIEQTTDTMERLNAPIEDNSEAFKNAVKPSKDVAKALSDIEKEYRNLGLTMMEIRLYDFLDMGGSLEDFARFKSMLEEINLHNGNKKSGTKSSKGGLNYFDDRLKSITEEIAKLKALNQSLEEFGEEGRFTSVQELTLELMNQDSVLSGISDKQKQMLIDQAAILDSEKQLNDLLKLRYEYDKNFDDLEFELSLLGKTSKEIENLTFERELEARVKAISNGASKETIALLEEEIRKIRERKAAIDGNKDAKDNDPLGGMKDGFNNYINSMGTVREQFATVTEATFGGLTDAIASFASGADQSFSDMTRSVLQNISRMLIQMAIINTMKMAFGGYADGGLVGRPNAPSVGDIGGGIPYPRTFSSGGYTGVGGKYQTAGLVHRDEYVINKEATGNIGVGVLDQFHSWAKSGAHGVFQVGVDSGAIQAVSNMSSAPSFSPYSASPIVAQASSPNIVMNNSAAPMRPIISPPSAIQNNQQGDLNLKVIIYSDDSTEASADIDGKAIERTVRAVVDRRLEHHARQGGFLANRK